MLFNYKLFVFLYIVVLLVVDCTKIRHYKATAQGPQLAYIQPLDEKGKLFLIKYTYNFTIYLDCACKYPNTFNVNCYKYK